MKFPFIFPFLVPLTLITNACSSSMNTPDIKRNPSPKVRYEITLTITDAPGRFDSAEGYVSYEVTNEQCAPFEKFAGIYRKPPSQHPSFSLARVSDNEYKGIVYLDLLQDEDYYGLGVCHWKPINVGAQLKAGKVAFSPYISVDKVASQQSSMQYFYRSDYGIETSSHSDSATSLLGSPVTDYLEKHPELRFEIIMTAKEKIE